MNATMRFIVWGTIPVGAILGGIIATALRPPRRRSGSAGSGPILAVVPLLITPVHTLKTMPEPVDDTPAVRMRPGSDGTDGTGPDGTETLLDESDATDLPADAPGFMQR